MYKRGSERERKGYVCMYVYVRVAERDVQTSKSLFCIYVNLILESQDWFWAVLFNDFFFSLIKRERLQSDYDSTQRTCDWSFCRPHFIIQIPVDTILPVSPPLVKMDRVLYFIQCYFSFHLFIFQGEQNWTQKIQKQKFIVTNLAFRWTFDGWCKFCIPSNIWWVFFTL